MPHPNQQPTLPSPLRMALIGDIETPNRWPFNWLLKQALGSMGLCLEQCFCGSILGGDCMGRAVWASDAVQAGVRQLLSDLTAFQPNIIVCMGSAALHLLHNGNVPPKQTKAGNSWPASLAKWRGSLWLAHERLFAAAPLAPHDPICLIHGLPASQHDCLYCCLCFKPLTPAQCHVLPNGSREDVCEACAAAEQARVTKKALQAPTTNLTVPASDGQSACLTDHAATTPSLQTSSLASSASPYNTAGGVGLFSSTNAPTQPWKCLATWSPGHVERNYAAKFDLLADLRRARDEAVVPALELPTMDIRWGPENN